MRVMRARVSAHVRVTRTKPTAQRRNDAKKLKKENKNDKNITAMINKNDYGSYEAPEAIVFGIVNKEILCSSPQEGTPGDDDTLIDVETDY